MRGRPPLGTFKFLKLLASSGTRGKAECVSIASNESAWRWWLNGWHTFNDQRDIAPEENKMPKTTTPKGIKATPVKREARDDVPQFFRLNVEVGDLDGADRVLHGST